MVNSYNQLYEHRIVQACMMIFCYKLPYNLEVRIIYCLISRELISFFNIDIERFCEIYVFYLISYYFYALMICCANNNLIKLFE